MRFLPNTNFTKRSDGTYYSACKECNKIFKHTVGLGWQRRVVNLLGKNLKNV